MRFLVISFLVVASAGGAEKVVVPWSFKPLKRPALPQVEPVAGGQDLDRFIVDRQRAEQAEMAAPADRATLIRRVTLDLHGLLPTTQEVEAFVHAPEADEEAFERVVEGLLQSPRFGERWGRHWLDVVRYADSVGRSWNAPFIAAARYRDWVMDAFNADMPYTTFVAAQVAGDLLPEKTRARTVVGTGMLALGSMDLTALQYDLFRLDRIDDQIDVTTRAFLGLTVACARCHDHKKDPVTQADYYALAGLFESSQTWTGTAHKAEHRGNLYVEPEYLYRVTEGNQPRGVTSSRTGAINAMDAAPAMMSEEVVQPRQGNEPIRYGFDPGLVMAVTDDKPANCAIRVAGDPYQEGKTVSRGELAIPGLPPMPKVGPQESGRLQLAQWLTTPTHPLTARVMVNRVWAHLFGQGIVRTVDDFGITGEKPDHPELLDHLAVRFVEGGWSVKKLIKMLVLSRTYRQSHGKNSAATPKEWLAGMPLRRLEMEVMRDVLLQVSDQLSFDRPVGVMLAGNGGKGNSGRTRGLIGLESPYRTVYLPVLRDLLTPMHEVWDFPNPSQIQGQREVTTVPAQGLFMLNNGFVMEASQLFARAVADLEQANPAEKVAQVYRKLLCRAPEAEEVEEALAFVEALGGGVDGLAGLAQAVMGSAEFRYR